MKYLQAQDGERSMKIVFLAPFGIRPKGTLIARMLPLAVGMQELGHRVTIVAPPYTNPEDAGLTEIVRGVRLLNVQLGPGGKVLSTLPVSWRMLRAALAEKPDVIHLFKPKGYGGIAAMLMLSLKRLGLGMPPVFLDTDDLEGSGGMNELHPYSSVEKRVYAFQEQWLIKQCPGVTVASLALQKYVAEAGISNDRTLYLPNCVEEVPEIDGAAQRKKLGIAADVPLLLLYTRFFEFRQERLHELFATICRELPAVHFMVIGKGRNREEELLKQAAVERGFDRALTLLGWVEPEQLPELLASADLAVYPFEDTLINRAKCPAKLTELLRSGIPVVADNVGQIPEYLAPELRSFLCQPGDVNSMAKHCMELLNNRGGCRELGRSAKEFILQHFRWLDYAAKLEQFYQTISTDK
jgi:glycosyltransferase involved in cell wall biosynthesis